MNTQDELAFIRMIEEISKGVGLTADKVALLDMLAEGIVNDDMMQKLGLYAIVITPIITGFHSGCIEEKAMVPSYRSVVKSMRDLLEKHVTMLDEMLDQPDFTNGQKANTNH